MFSVTKAELLLLMHAGLFAHIVGSASPVAMCESPDVEADLSDDGQTDMNSRLSRRFEQELVFQSEAERE